MPRTVLETRWGGGPENPTIDEMQSALAELTTPDPEHPDCWLSDESGLTIAAHEGGKVVLENPESDAGPRYLKCVPPEIVLQLWLALQAGDLDAIQKHGWLDGYGN
jgi:hypothetical protein